MAEKLHIPGPDEHEDFTELNEGIVYAWAVCMLIAIALFIFFRDRRPPEMPPEPDDPVVAHQQEIVERAERSRRSFEGIDWQIDDAVAVFRHGPREAAETACERLAEPLETGTLSNTVQLELVGAVEQHAPHAPWNCLVRRHFAQQIDDDLELADEMDAFWAEAEAFDAPAGIMGTVLEEFRRTRDRPEHADFYSWLRLCALHPEYGAAEACRQILYQISPEQGADILAAAVRHLEERTADQLADDLKVWVPGVGALAERGQPQTWRVEGQDGAAAYDAKLRVGAIFQLCRVVNSPDEQIARLAAQQLASAAHIGARAADENVLTRWRQACQLAFRVVPDGERADGESAESEQADGDKTDGEKAEADEPKGEPAAALAVWSGDQDEPPNYAMAEVVERGECPGLADDQPVWQCALGLWQGADEDIDLALMGFFNETRYIEWAGE